MKTLKILFFALVVFAACKKQEPAQLVIWINKQTYDSLGKMDPKVTEVWFDLLTQSDGISRYGGKDDYEGFYTDNPVPGANNVVTLNIDIKETTVFYLKAMYMNTMYSNFIFMTKTLSYWDIKIEPGKIHYFQVR